ncbi:alpha/beta hydrolase [Kitasatospora aureofaciens]|uniref:alpha/beta hydrolase n=1 Tax=Kitasatospora aureofaciens TaxID=1894 RepID=UPI001C464EA2|nr:alpha/beta hydrolase [Kitasatospora aureofaciens]MBV6700450.1 alpha/beta hydrolase [Kitasatospora aureofaciens]
MHTVVRGAGALGLTALLLASSAGCQGGTTSAAEPAPTSAATASATGSLTFAHLDWQACPAPNAAQGGGTAPAGDWQCATLKAPLDYAKPSDGTIDLALIRSRAKDEQHRIGSLLFNFGGPGGSGVATLPALAAAYTSLNTRYDLVSFDPRGVGASAGVKCLDDKAMDASNAIGNTPENPAAVKELDETTAQFNAACEHNSGPVLPFVDTESAARDMDLMRQALGDQHLYYFGISYGTELGGVYAHLFPQQVGRLVLDSVVDPTKDPLQNSLGQAKGFQLALEDFMKACSTQVSDCPTGSGGAQGTARITELLQKVEKTPLPTSSDRQLTGSLAVTGIAGALYSQETWPALAAGLAEAMRQGSGTVLLQLADSLLGRGPNGHYNNLNAANRAISCVDAKQRYSDQDVEQQLPQFRTASPVFGAFTAWGLTNCTGWPVPGRTDHPDVAAPGAAPILVVGTTGDPATPVEGARAMAQQLGAGVGVTVTLQGEGHGGYNTGNPCLKQTVDSYLLDGKVPADGTVCSRPAT